EGIADLTCEVVNPLSIYARSQKAVLKGYMRQRGKSSWQLLVHVGTDENGRKRYASKTIHGTKREAQTELADFVSEVSRGGQVPSGPVTVERVVREWLAAKSLR